MKNSKITFIGGGNMASSLIGGLLDTGVAAKQLTVVDSNSKPLAAKFPIQCYTNYVEAIKDADVVVLAVKPQVLPEVAKSISAILSEPLPLFISIAAGIRLNDLSRWLNVDSPLALIRAMPNTPALVQSGASALCAGKYVNDVQKELAENILRAVGLTIWVEDETQMDAVTALSGSGPAYFFYIMEVIEKSGINLGLSKDVARLLTLQTAFGAAKMALESQEDAAILRERVTSKGGTTEQAINTLQAGNLQSLFDQALKAAQKRAVNLAIEFGEH
jgi:pyrroline-5-carboxylate reductase